MLLLFCCISFSYGEDLVTKSGKVFKDYKVVSKSKLGIQIAHKGGLARVLFSDLPDNVRYNYSPDLEIPGHLFENYSIEEVTHDKVKVTHKEGTDWILHRDLPTTLLKKYSTEIKRQKKIFLQKQQIKRATALKKKRRAEFLTGLLRAENERDEQRAIEIITGLINSQPHHPQIEKARSLLEVKQLELSTRNTIEKAKKQLTCQDAIDLLEYAIKQRQNAYTSDAKLLLESLKDIQQRGFSPIYCAIARNDIQWIDQLLKKGADIDDLNYKTPPLIFGIINDSTSDSTISHLISLKANINIQEKRYGWTPLIAACKNRSQNIVKMLLNAGADVNKTDNEMMTALHSAVVRGDVPVVRLLMQQHGIDVSLKNKHGITAPMLAKGVSDGRKRYELLVLFNNIVFPTKTQLITYGEKNIVIDWNLTPKEAEANGYKITDDTYASRQFNVYHDGRTAFLYFHKRNNDLVKVTLFDTATDKKYWSFETYGKRTKKSLLATVELYGNEAKVININSGKSKYSYCGIIVPFKTMMLYTCGYAGYDTYICNIRIFNPAYFPTVKEFLEKISMED